VPSGLLTQELEVHEINKREGTNFRGEVARAKHNLAQVERAFLRTR